MAAHTQKFYLRRSVIQPVTWTMRPPGVLTQAVGEAVGTAVRQALEDRRFDVRANVYTLIAITGVILYWRGVWTLW